jgi:NAD(P)-dependent dehydrogenase (short-subunit alcohol dehydrogenase family)
MENTALVSGSSKRIGKAIAEYLAKKGWNIFVHYNTSATAAELLVAEFSAAFPEQRFHAVKADLSKMEEVLDLIPKLVADFGSFDLLVNNASVFDKGYINATSLDLFNSQLDVNLKAPFFLMRDFATLCKSGNIINLVDTRVTSNKTNFAAYSLSKKGLWDLTQMAALEFAPEIRVNAIAPGVTLAPEHEDENYLNDLAKAIPMKRPGGLNPILKSIDYILNNEYLTGQLLFADGGENLGINV